MGQILSWFSSLFGQEEVRILILGLDAAGKTTILYRLQCGKVIPSMPTIGFNMEVVECENVKFKVWDLGGQSSLRPYWKCYYEKCSAIIFVVDSTDKERLSIAKDELHSMLSEPELKETIIAVFANKQDMAGALTSAEISDKLMLHTIKSHTWNIFNTSAITGAGLEPGLKWVANQIKAKH
ncbi:ADP-ribosylation factor, putative [Entamoeba invadens IP1]|uniref:ADP-ribosylation factor, putative n=1 Tax=Entamoeba invadens IP1 TaxID=370355 RepID=UPI0002C3F9B0|nr:ADP-ribosylation factor, putative [Entamoeba invadens IP1]ELP85134.1 ADP-ribosylation factor, putative [Entamoeba invadens IP1]|eukprot:XP_004184480.1 ADP-ribosylation factor, putative [Entamoeba invadens IP1]